MLSVYKGINNYPVKCQLYYPIYQGDGPTKKAIEWQPSDIFCYCRESGFMTTQTKEQNRRYKEKKGVLTTNTLKKDEITVDWKIMFEDELFIIDRLEQTDDKKQQVLMRNPEVITTLYVRC